MLSRLMLVTHRATMQPDFAAAIRAALEGGARLIQLREKDLADDELRILARETACLCRNFGATLIINSRPDMARELRATEVKNLEFQVGVHWPQRLIPQQVSPKDAALLYGASVHSVETALRAENAGVDYLVFGSVFPTTSHPDEESAGLETLRAVTAATTLPVYAIGGIADEYSISACLEAGAFGVAVRSAVWEALSVREKVEEMLRDIGE